MPFLNRPEIQAHKLESSPLPLFLLVLLPKGAPELCSAREMGPLVFRPCLHWAPSVSSSQTHSCLLKASCFLFKGSSAMSRKPPRTVQPSLGGFPFQHFHCSGYLLIAFKKQTNKKPAQKSSLKQ